MALVEIEAGPHRVTAAITRDAVEELGLAEGVEATAMVKATSVMVERGGGRRRRARRALASALACSPRCGRRMRRRQLGRGREHDRGGGELVVSAAASLEPAFTAYAEAAGIDAKQSFAGSDDLAAQIRQGVTPGRLRRRQHQPPRRPLRRGPGLQAGRLRHQHAGARGARGLADRLARRPDRRDVTLAIGDEGVPVGDYTREVLARPADTGVGGDPRQRALARARRRRDRRQAHPGRGRRRLRLRHRRGRHRRRADRDRPARRSCSPTSPTAPRWSKGAENPEGAQSFIDGLLEGDGADALARRPASGRRRELSDDAAGPSRSCCSPRSRSRSLFLILPIVAIFADTAPADLIDSLGSDASRDALWLSLQTTLAALVVIVVVGTPAAYLLATREFRGKALVTTAIELPLVLPPAVAGIGLLAAFGPEGIFGSALDDAGIELVLQTAGRDRRADLRRRALLPAPGAGGVRGGRPRPARRGAHARRRRGAGVLARRDPLRRRRDRRPGWRSPGAGRWASSGRR